MAHMPRTHSLSRDRRQRTDELSSSAARVCAESRANISAPLCPPAKPSGRGRAAASAGAARNPRSHRLSALAPTRLCSPRGAPDRPVASYSSFPYPEISVCFFRGPPQPRCLRCGNGAHNFSLPRFWQIEFIMAVFVCTGMRVLCVPAVERQMCLGLDQSTSPGNSFVLKRISARRFFGNVDFLWHTPKCFEYIDVFYWSRINTQFVNCINCIEIHALLFQRIQKY
jgi:hypothetical protein